MTYERTARVGMTDYGPIRLTIENQLKASAADGAAFVSRDGAPPVTESTIVEMKFRAGMPAVFKLLVEEFALDGTTGVEVQARHRMHTRDRGRECLSFCARPSRTGNQSADVLLRLVAAADPGRRRGLDLSRHARPNDAGPTFPVTLVLLSVLIAAFTQVIGDNIARAFSLVGALSIVRFRTVVRDTQDTAFVIFAVVVGMAVGARDLAVSGIGFAVVGVAAFLMRPRAVKSPQRRGVPRHASRRGSATTLKRSPVHCSMPTWRAAS